MTRILSGITPSGHLTLGNYLGALRRFAAGGDGTYFVSDLHALTTEHDQTTSGPLQSRPGCGEGLWAEAYR